MCQSRYLLYICNVYIILLMSVLESIEKLEDIKDSKEDLEKRDSDLDRQIKDLEKQHDDLLQKKREIEDKKENELKGTVDKVDKLMEEMREKDKLPTHERNMEIYMNSKNGEAVQECIMYMHRALESVQTDSDTLDISDPNKVKLIDNISEVNITEGEPGKPQVFVKKIQKEKLGWFGSHKHPRQFEDTDEVLVVIKLNNNTDGNPNSNTIIEAVVKTTQTENGDLAVKIGMRDPGLYRMESQQQFSDGRFSDNLSYDAKMRRGEMTLDEYHAKYKKEHGETLTDYHKKRDQKLEKDPRYTNSKQEREDFIESIPDRYTHLLETAQNFRDETQKSLDEILKKKRENFDEVRHDETFLVLAIDIVKLIEQDAGRVARGETPLHTKRIQNAKAAVLRFYPNLSMAELERITG